MSRSRSRSLWSALLCRSLLVASCAALAPGQSVVDVDVPAVLDAAVWTEDEVGVGVMWRSARFEDLFDARQSLCVLEVETTGRERRLRFAAMDPFAAAPTSQLARWKGALCAVNGGFFDTKTGAPFGLLMEGGVVRVEQDELRNVAVGVDRRERVTIEERPPGRWPTMQHARGSWPLLLRGGEPVKPGGWGERDVRHPRTALGVTKAGGLVLLTVDGRTDEAAGMTLLELARTMQALGCETAMNLDGGGSSTMWIRGRGTVNHPCDNQRFDHLGERPVSDAVLILAARVLRIDEDQARLLPAGAWQRREDPACIGGDFAVATRAADGAAGLPRVELDVDLDLAGTYAVELRWPRIKGGVRELSYAVGDAEPCTVAATGRSAAWVRVGTQRLPRGASIVVIGASGVGEFAFDALRLVEIR